MLWSLCGIWGCKTGPNSGRSPAPEPVKVPDPSVGFRDGLLWYHLTSFKFARKSTMEQDGMSRVSFKPDQLHGPSGKSCKGFFFFWCNPLVPVHRHINNFFGDIFVWYGTIGCWQLRASVGYISFITGFARPMVASSPMFVTHCLAFGPMRKSYYFGCKSLWVCARANDWY